MPERVDEATVTPVEVTVPRLTVTVSSSSVESETANTFIVAAATDGPVKVTVFPDSDTPVKLLPINRLKSAGREAPAKFSGTVTVSPETSARLSATRICASLLASSSTARSSGIDRVSVRSLSR